MWTNVLKKKFIRLRVSKTSGEKSGKNYFREKLRINQSLIFCFKFLETLSLIQKLLP